LTTYSIADQIERHRIASRPDVLRTPRTRSVPDARLRTEIGLVTRLLTATAALLGRMQQAVPLCRQPAGPANGFRAGQSVNRPREESTMDAAPVQVVVFAGTYIPLHCRGSIYGDDCCSGMCLPDINGGFGDHVCTCQTLVEVCEYDAQCCQRHCCYADYQGGKVCSATPY
jgi:hypothetical protein